MSARFGLRIRRRGGMSASVKELVAKLRSSTGSQGAIRERRLTRAEPPEGPKKRRRRVALKPPTYRPADQLARLRKVVDGIRKRATKKPRIPKAIQRAIACLEAGVPNTGRQWRKLRKQLRSRARA